jgi:hypothetical protein
MLLLGKPLKIPKGQKPQHSQPAARLSPCSTRDGPQIGPRRRQRRRRRRGSGRPNPWIRLRLHRPPLPRPPSAALLLPPASAHPPEAAVQPGAPLPHDRLLPHPPHLLRRRLRPRLRRHRRAPRHRQRPGPRHRRRPPRRLPPGARQRPVHHRGPLLRVHVPPRRHRHYPPRPRRRPHQAPEPPRFLRRRRRSSHRHRLRHGHALSPHQDPRLPMVRLISITGLIRPDPLHDLATSK